MKRTGGVLKPFRDDVPPPPWTPAASRVAKDDWRKMKTEFNAESERRAKARMGNT